MHWLIRAYIEKFKFVGMMIAGIIPPAIVAAPIGRYLGKLWGIDDQLIVGVCFFILLAVEVYIYDRFQQWRYFRKLRQ